MKTLLSIILILGFQFFTVAQQFVLEATIEKSIYEIFDIDGDGVCEYIADTNKVYDGSTHQLKYSFPGTRLYWQDATTAQNPYSKFPHIDFNSDGNREIIYSDYQTVNIYDLVNNQIIFTFDPPEENSDFISLIDIDGDGVLELVLRGYTYSYPNPDIEITYIYSTGVSVTSKLDSEIDRPNNFSLNQNYPNPFNPSTTIRYSISSPGNISIKVYDISGQIINVIDKEHNQPGEYEIIWDGTNSFGERVASGVYFYQLITDRNTEAKKMMLLK